MTFNKVMAVIKSIVILGILAEKRRYFWKIFFWSVYRKPKAFPLAITYSIYGYHFRKVFREVI
jgi:hypothetical protein